MSARHQKISEDELRAAFAASPSVAALARELGMDERSLRRRLQRLGITREFVQRHPARPIPAAPARDAEIDALKGVVSQLQKDQLTAEYVRRKIFELKDADPTPPAWVLGAKKRRNPLTGIPVLFASDWHWGEVVDPAQINGINRYDMAIARERARNLIDKTHYLLTVCFNSPVYEGIVFALGGDMVSGDIHDELSVTNEQPIMPTVIDLFGVLSWCIESLATRFGRVFVPCVTGNHGRNTLKIRAKGRAHTSFDWLLCMMLAKRYEADDRIQFLIPDGPDAYFRVYGHRYLLTHGDQFRGGDGMIGALGPIIRGDHKKRSRNGQIDMGYDTLLLGHWHQCISLRRLIVNGSLIGYNEYAYAGNFGYEPPQQALWITHPDNGITFSMPVNVDTAKKSPGYTSWVSVFGSNEEAA